MVFFVHDDGILAPLRDGDRHHVPLLELAVVIEGALVLLVAHGGNLVELLAGYVLLGGDELAGGEHRLPGPGVPGEGVLDPVLDLRRSARRRGLRVDHLGAIAGPVRRYDQSHLRVVALRRSRSRVNAGDGGSAGL